MTSCGVCERKVAMKRILLIAILIFSVFIQACGSWKYVPVGANAIDPGCYRKDYQLGVKKTAFIGQEIINLKEYHTTIPVALSQGSATIETRYKLSRILLTIESDNTYPLRGTINNGQDYYLIEPSGASYYNWKLLISADGRISKESLYSQTYEMVYTPNEEISITPQNYKLSFTGMCDGPILSYQLIYSGINDVSLNMTYKEFTGDDIARPSFFQNLTYNANAKQIRFKNFLIQIHDVTNEKITYTILEDGLK